MIYARHFNTHYNPKHYYSANSGNKEVIVTHRADDVTELVACSWTRRQFA